MTMATPKSRSSLVSHTYPPFYSCYLLKSIQTLHSKATYIGSTPDPPRRIRQHNGELTQGAWKTSKKRPWVMQMVVHGFPSRLAALQFEWAWQHPSESRHLRIDGVKLFTSKARGVSANIRVLRKMIALHPFNNWPLQVKLFTEDAVKGWKGSCKELDDGFPLPLGFQFTTELEGVDGNSGNLGSGRKGRLDVTDNEFTVPYLAKYQRLLSSKESLKCSVCKKPLRNYASDPTTTTLCPTSSCLSVSHLSCLSTKFLKAESSTAGGNKNPLMIPRGGECSQCHNYVLWGDIVRGCYRRANGLHAGAAPPEIEEDPDLSESAMLAVSPLKKSTRKGKGKEKVTGRAAAKRIVLGDIRTDSEPGEFFDLDAVSSGTESEEEVEVPLAVKRKPGRPRKASLSPARLSMEDVLARIPAPGSSKLPQPVVPPLTMEDVMASIQPPTSPTKRPRAIPTQNPAPLASPSHTAKLTMDDVLLKIALPPSSPSKHKRLKLTPPRPKPKTPKRRLLHTKAAPNDNDGEFFDLNAISAGSEDEEDGVPPAPVLHRAGPSRPAPSEVPPTPFIARQKRAAEVREAKLTFFDDDVDADPDRGNSDSGSGELDDSLGLSRAMSVLSVSSGPNSPGVIIELSD